MFYFIKTYGCQMNVHESEKIAAALERLGYVTCTNEKQADIIVFNTCCIRETAEAKIKGHIGELKRLKVANPSLIIAVCGCMTQQDGAAESLSSRFPFVDIVIGTHNLHLLEDAIINLQKAKNKKRFVDTAVYNEVVELSSFRTSYPNAWVNIIYGCNNFCSYCIVPYVRGRERSRKQEDILNEIINLINDGYKEITLLGQNVNSYGKDLNDGSNFATLLKQIASLPGDFRLRFMTSHPKDLSAEVIDVIAANERICKSIHLPVQSGSNSILTAMNRRYTREKYLDLIRQIRAKMPDAGITSDIIVGFPGESQQDFEDTLALVKEVRFSSLFCFIYSRRKGTPAAVSEGQLTRAEKSQRVGQLIALQNGITNEISNTYRDKVYKVLIDGINEKYEGVYCGRTDCGRLVNVKSDRNLVGEFVNLRIFKWQSATLWGSIEEN